MTKAFLSCFKKTSAATLTSPECFLTVYPCYFEFVTRILHRLYFKYSSIHLTVNSILLIRAIRMCASRKGAAQQQLINVCLLLMLKIDGFSEKRVRFGVRALYRCSSRNGTHMICDSIFNVDYRAEFVRGVDKRSQQLWRNVYTWDLIRHEDGSFNV